MGDYVATINRLNALPANQVRASPRPDTTTLPFPPPHHQFTSFFLSCFFSFPLNRAVSSSLPFPNIYNNRRARTATRATRSGRR
jgi:hypothetical protein